jgi:hypothetical protein
VHALMVVVCLFVVVYGSRLCLETMGQSIAELPWLPVGVTYLAIPLGALDPGVCGRAPGWGSQKHREIVAFGKPTEG